MVTVISMTHSVDRWNSLAEVTPLHLRVSTFLLHGLNNGDYPRNRPLPSSRVLAEQLGVSRTTVQTALQNLVDDQKIVAHPRSGMYPVAVNLAQDVEPVNPVDWREMFYRVPPPVPQNVEPDHARFPFPFLSGQIEPGAFPTRSWLKAVNTAMSGRNLRVSLGDPLDGDDPELVSALIEEVLALRGVHADASNILITVGAQQALSLLSSALLGPGIRLGCENPGYPDAQQLFASSGAHVQHLDVDSSGAIPEQSHGAQVVYLTPSSHHPTSVVLSPERRLRFLQIAREQGSVIIEDDYEAEIRLQGPPLAPMKSIDPDGRVIYLGTFSKYLAPGLRLGYIVGAADLIADLRRFRHYSTKAPSPMLQRSLAVFIRSGDYSRQLRSYRVRARSKFERLRESMDRFLPHMSDQLVVPQMNTWLRTVGGEDTSDWARRARERGVVVTPGKIFYAPGTSHRHDQLRVGLASIPEARISRGIEELARAEQTSL